MIVPLVLPLERNPGLFEEVVLHHAALDVPGAVEADLHKLAKPARVVVADRLGVTWTQSTRHNESYLLI